MSIEKTVRLTAVGKARLEEELEELRERQRELYRNVQDANTNNEASDSSEYEEIKDDLVYTEARVRDLENVLQSAEIIEEGSPDGVVALGSHVTVKFEDGESEAWVIVSPEEASAPDGRVSTDSPVGRALLGSRDGDTITVLTPGGEVSYTVVSVS